MLSFQPLSGKSSDLDRYYDNKDDYYHKEDAGIWIGKGAKELSVENEAVVKEEFMAALDGEFRGLRLRKKTFSKQYKNRKGIDFTFSAPKSVSIQALMGSDPVMLEAHEHAVRAGFAHIEKMAARRQHQGRQTRILATQNLVAAVFRHELSREMEPHLHSHCVTLNTSFNGENWGALSNEMMLKSVMTAGLIYRRRLAEYLQAKGYSLRPTKDGFELAHISDKAIRALSTRSKQIEYRLHERGKTRTDALSWEKQKEVLGTRQKKQTVHRDLLMTDWLRKTEGLLNPVELSYLASQSTDHSPLHTTSPQQRQNDAAAAVMFAITHLEERQGLFTHNELSNEAMQSGLLKGFDFEDIARAIAQAEQAGIILSESRTLAYIKGVNQLVDERFFKDKSAPTAKTYERWLQYYVDHGLSVEDAINKIGRDKSLGALVPSAVRYASARALQREANILQMEHDGRNNLKAVMSHKKTQKLLGGASLNTGQLSAADMILTSRHRFTGVQGFAGTGKSHTFSAIYTALAQSGSNYHLVGLAPKKTQVQALAELGMPANTVAHFLRSPKKQNNINKHTILLLDEAGTISSKEIEQLMQLVKERDARLVMVGDARQTHAVEAGKPFELLQDSGMAMAHMDRIMRQQTEVNRAAVELAAHGDVVAAITELSQSEHHTPQTLIDTQIIELKTAKSRFNAVANDYVTHYGQDNTLVITGTNESRHRINQIIRAKLGIEDQASCTTLTERDFTVAQRKQTRSYQEGDVVIFNRNAENGIKRDDCYYVENVYHDIDRLFLRQVDSLEGVYFNVKTGGHRLNVYEQQETALGTGDHLRITRNDMEHGFMNGDLVTIAKVEGDKLFFTDGRQWQTTTTNNFNHAYCSTIHSAQGMTCDHVIFHAETKTLTANQMTFYVGISRPKHGVKIYTDDLANMGKAYAREANKLNAVDIQTYYHFDNALDKSRSLAKASRHASQQHRSRL